MSISKDKVKKIGNLAKIKLTNDEIEIYSTQLTQIVDFMNKLDEVDTSKVESVINQNLDHHSNRLNDIVEDGNYVEKILKNAPDSKEGFFTTIKVIE
ncbi:MAG: Asp-tRNA(Asn)/Glu-tRNA(Gln) amidotransferase subunit GatC [Pseudomonadota bacterium]|jgi:aspartyl-tRNA(Asn)/glutamyl-tRNA(Gln) amidotransferase subunit C|nr:Asp-tRNA(Asn)/Glu-tRNA(Gln) amidotransferase subunit GatC [Pseudomonadota bacterium]|tara:strand:+ start:766 stop:1056 length:291 start_codon:yes stop_codon:yes gene_type:complete